MISKIIFITGITTFAQKSEILLNHYKNEHQSFKEFALNNSAFKGDTNIDVYFYHLDLSVEINFPFIEGKVSCGFKPLKDKLNTVKLDLNSALIVDSISTPCDSFYQEGDNIYITLDNFYSAGEPLELSVFYHGIPALAGGYKGLRYETHGQDEPIIATLSTPYLAHYWYPCKDGPEDKADSVYIDLTIADTIINGNEVIAVSNGILENTIDNGDSKTFQWRHRYPIVTYYVMIAISNYVHFQQEFSGTENIQFPLDYYVFEEDLSASQTGVSDLPDVMEFFSDIFGKYPFREEKYGMTQLGYYGGIENQTNTIVNSMTQPWFYISVHELAHMWFAAMITCADWHHGWLNESFATYSEALWQEHIYGIEAYREDMQNNEYYGGGTLFLENAQDTFNTFPAIIYQKGAYVLHMLRGVLGDELFFESLLNYSQHPDFIYGNADTEDMQQVFENTSGLDLGFFFDQWVYDEYYPYYKFNYFQSTENKFILAIYQAQEEMSDYRPLFEMPLQLKFTFANGGDTTIIVWNDEQFQQFYFDFPMEVDSLELDPDNWILNEKLFDPGLPVSIHAPGIVSNPVVYPNPFNNKVQVQLPENNKYSELKLINAQGETVKHLSIENQKQIVLDCADLPSGNYYLNFIGGKETSLQKIIKFN